jgi:hypothetical protein
VLLERELPADAAALADELRELEDLRAVVAARQARAAVAFVDAQRADQLARGVPASRLGRGISAQVGLARRISPWEAARYVGQARILITELPHCFARLSAGDVSEWRVMRVAQETGWLSREHRAVVDTEIAPQLHRLGTATIVSLTRKLAYRLDPHGYLARLAKAEAERYVGLRPVPDCMARLTAVLPMKQAIAVYAALKSYADLHVGVEDETRTPSQIMADRLFELVTGLSSADDVGINVDLIITDETLFTPTDVTADDFAADDFAGEAVADEDRADDAGDDFAGDADGGHAAGVDNAATRGAGAAGADEPAYLIGGGWIPAALARRMIRDTSGEATVLIRRLYRNPTTGQLAAMDSKSRLFTDNQRKFLILRDQTCRTPWCDAHIRHADHITPAEQGGPTSIHNGQGLCQACNHAKQAPGWHQTANDNGTITTVTPTGHQYQSQPPDPPGAPATESSRVTRSSAAA